MNSREIKLMRKGIESHFGCFFTQEYTYFRNESGKIFAISSDVTKIKLDALRIDRIGLYIVREESSGLRLSKEGAHLLWQQNPKQVKLTELSSDEVIIYFQGKDLPKDLGEEAKNIILSFKKQILGCARYKNGSILNFLPKMHRGTVII